MIEIDGVTKDWLLKKVTNIFSDPEEIFLKIHLKFVINPSYPIIWEKRLNLTKIFIFFIFKN